ncbi:MAG: acetyl-CoA carboxylase biotin carboxyl carrier protein [Armatimonadota bacterium]
MSTIDLNLTEQIIKRLTSSGAISLNIKCGDSQLHLVRGGVGTNDEKPGAVLSSVGGGDALQDVQTEPQTISVNAQLVGSFRNLQKPVQIGQIVIEGQPLGNIESMSILNEISSPAPGIISNIHLSEGDPAQYGTVLFELSEVESPDDELGI